MLTLQKTKDRLPSSVKFLQATDADATLTNYINRVCERFHNRGKWSGTTELATINIYGSEASDYFITLPRHLKTCIRGGRPGYHTAQTQGKWYQFLGGGAGLLDTTARHYGPLQDLGFGFMTYDNLPAAGAQLIVSTSETEASATYLYIRGRDENGDKIYSTVSGSVIEGIRIDLSSAPATTTQTFGSVYQVTKAVTKGTVSVSYGSTEIAKYEPGETDPDYRRYLSGGYTADEWEVIRGYFKRQHVWATAANDPIYPDNLEAIKLGIQALQAEEEGNVEQAQYYEGMAIDMLNSQLSEENAGIPQHLQFQTAAGRSVNIY